MTTADDRWAAGDAYEAYMGRWSRPLAAEFVAWLDPSPGSSWLDVGCGTGALTAALVEAAAPSWVTACDPAEAFIETARRDAPAGPVEFVVSGSGDLPERDGGYGHVTSLLVLNFLPDPVAGVKEMRDRSTPRGSVSACVWDYAGEMTFLRAFWDEASALDPRARELDEGVRFPICAPGPLTDTLEQAGLREVRTGAIQIPTRFASFDDYWTPFLGGTGPAPSYVASLDDAGRQALRDALERRLAPDGGPIDITARAWAVRGAVG